MKASTNVTPLSTCAHERTGSHLVGDALGRAAYEWFADGDVKCLRSALLRIVTALD